MQNIILFTIFFLFIILISFIFKKKKLFLNFTGQEHQRFTSSGKVPLIGGILLFLFFFLFVKNYILAVILFFFLVLGMLSDLSILNSVKIRFLYQLFLTAMFVLFLDIKVIDLRIPYLNDILENNFVNFFFCIFCLLILLNGSNFLDGSNTLVIGYYAIVTLIISFSLNHEINLNKNLIFNDPFLNLFFIFLIAMYFANLFEYIFLGDAGVYLIVIFIAYILFDIHMNNQFISPYYICILLWYPAFENFFSIIRKTFFKKSPLEPDTNHLHQLLFFYLKNKYKIKRLICNGLSANLLNLYNLVILYFSTKFIYDTKSLIILIILNSTIYLILYTSLLSFKLRFK